jgi:hypothetical protein
MSFTFVRARIEDGLPRTFQRPQGLKPTIFAFFGASKVVPCYKALICTTLPQEKVALG